MRLSNRCMLCCAMLLHAVSHNRVSHMTLHACGMASCSGRLTAACHSMVPYSTLCYAQLRHTDLCCAMLYCNALWYAPLHCAMLCCTRPGYAVLCHAMLRYAMLCCAMLCYAMLCHAMPCFAAIAMLCIAILKRHASYHSVPAHECSLRHMTTRLVPFKAYLEDLIPGVTC